MANCPPCRKISLKLLIIVTASFEGMRVMFWKAGIMFWRAGIGNRVDGGNDITATNGVEGGAIDVGPGVGKLAILAPGTIPRGLEGRSAGSD